MKTSEQIDKWAEALAKAQGQIQNPETNRTVKVVTRDGKSYTFDYADLPQCYDAAKKALSENGLCHTNTIDAEKSILYARVIHVSGQWIQSEYPLPSGSDPKALAAAVTYGKRYLFCALVGMAADEDQDVEPQNVKSSKSKTQEQPEEPQTRLRTVVPPNPESKAIAGPINASPDDDKMHRLRNDMLSLVVASGLKPSDAATLLKSKFGVENSKDLNLNQLGEFVIYLQELAIRDVK